MCIWGALGLRERVLLLSRAHVLGPDCDCAAPALLRPAVSDSYGAVKADYYSRRYPNGTPLRSAELVVLNEPPAPLRGQSLLRPRRRGTAKDSCSSSI